MKDQEIEEIIKDLKSRHLTTIEQLADSQLALLLIIQKLEGELLTYKRDNDKTVLGEIERLMYLDLHNSYL